MNILPLSITLLSNKKNNNIKLSQNTVAFGSGNYLEQKVDTLKKDFDEQIRPFIDDTKLYMIELTEIIKAQEELRQANSQIFMNLLETESKLLNLDKNKSLANSKDYLDKYFKFSNNLSEYGKLMSLAEKPMYKSKEIDDLFNSYAKFFEPENSQIELIKPLVKEYDLLKKDLSRKSGGFWSNNEENSLGAKIASVNNFSNEANYYCFVSPYYEASKLIQTIKFIENEVQKPTQSLMNTFKYIEKANESIANICNNKEYFYDKVDQIKILIANYKKQVDIESLKHNLEAQRNQTIVDMNNISVERSANMEHYIDGSLLADKLDMQSLNELLDSQYIAISKIRNKINEIKQKYIEENNKMFWG